MQRKQAILRAAGVHFGLHGFRGTSLREIARDAGVSLTLLNHHFGCKSAVLAGVIDAHRTVLDDFAAALRRVKNTAATRDIVRAWVRVGFETAARPDGESLLRLVARLLDDPSEPAGRLVRERLDEAARVFIEALQPCYPQAPRHAIAATHLWASAALLRFLTSGERQLRLASTEAPSRDVAGDQERLARFLVAGIDAALAMAPAAGAFTARSQSTSSNTTPFATAVG